MISLSNFGSFIEGKKDRRGCVRLKNIFLFSKLVPLICQKVSSP